MNDNLGIQIKILMPSAGNTKDIIDKLNKIFEGSIKTNVIVKWSSIDVNRTIGKLKEHLAERPLNIKLNLNTIDIDNQIKKLQDKIKAITIGLGGSPLGGTSTGKTKQDLDDIIKRYEIITKLADGYTTKSEKTTIHKSGKVVEDNKVTINEKKKLELEKQAAEAAQKAAEKATQSIKDESKEVIKLIDQYGKLIQVIKTKDAAFNTMSRHETRVDPTTGIKVTKNIAGGDTTSYRVDKNIKTQEAFLASQEKYKTRLDALYAKGIIPPESIDKTKNKLTELTHASSKLEIFKAEKSLKELEKLNNELNKYQNNISKFKNKIESDIKSLQTKHGDSIFNAQKLTGTDKLLRDLNKITSETKNWEQELIRVRQRYTDLDRQMSRNKQLTTQRSKEELFRTDYANKIQEIKVRAVLDPKSIANFEKQFANLSQKMQTALSKNDSKAFDRYSKDVALLKREFEALLKSEKDIVAVKKALQDLQATKDRLTSGVSRLQSGKTGQFIDASEANKVKDLIKNLTNLDSVKLQSLKDQIKNLAQTANQAFAKTKAESTLLQNQLNSINARTTGAIGLQGKVSLLPDSSKEIASLKQKVADYGNYVAQLQKEIKAGSFIGDPNKLKEELRQLALFKAELLNLHAAQKKAVGGQTSSVHTGQVVATSSRLKGNAVTEKDIAAALKLSSAYKDLEIREISLDRVTGKWTATLRENDSQNRKLKGTIDSVTGSLHRQSEALVQAHNRNLGMLQQLKIAMQRVPIWMIGMSAFYFPLQQIQAGIQTIKDLDASMISLRKVTGETLQTVKEFALTATETGLALGRSTKDVLDAAVAYARLGYSIRDANTLAKESLMLSIVGEMDTEQATRHIISTVRAFRIQVDEEGKNVRNVVDQINEIGEMLPHMLVIAYVY